jgi:hypothetical protein
MGQLEQQAQAANAMLSDCCSDTPGPPWHSGLFAEWGDRIPVLGIPEAVGATSCREPFHLPPAVARPPYCFNSTEFGTPTTVAAPPVPAQVSAYKPATVRDILTAEALCEIYQWFRSELAYLQGYSLDPPLKHCSNKQLVIDQSGFVAEARGLFWDLTTNPPSLMQRHLQGAPRLNAVAIRAAAGVDYQDKELLDGIAHGVRMQTDHQMLIVLNPGLLSLAGYLR